MGQPETIIIIAHRGNGPTSLLSGNGGSVPYTMAPENTLKAFRRALDEQADGIEFDVYLDKHGVPVIIHDDELNKNVEGANRQGLELGKVSQQSLAELKLYDVGQGERIPSLRETLDFFVEQNKIRASEGKPALIMNVELKGDRSWKNTSDICRTYVDQGLLQSSDFVFCSFKKEDLVALKGRHPDFQIAPCLKTGFLFGEENLIMPGWRVKDGATYQTSSLESLRQFHHKHNCAALDPVLWDTYRPLLDLAREEGLALHISTSDIRTYEPSHLKTLLSLEKTGVIIYFKTDEPAKVRAALAEMRSDVVRRQNTTEVTNATTVDTTSSIPAPKVDALGKPTPRPEATFSQIYNAQTPPKLKSITGGL